MAMAIADLSICQTVSHLTRGNLDPYANNCEVVIPALKKCMVEEADEEVSGKIDLHIVVQNSHSLTNSRLGWF